MYDIEFDENDDNLDFDQNCRSFSDETSRSFSDRQNVKDDDDDDVEDGELLIELKRTVAFLKVTN